MGAAGGIMQGVGAVESTIGTIISNLEGDKTRSALLRLEGTDPGYKESGYAKDRLGLAGNLLNARMPGAASMQQNIYGNQGAAMNNIDRNATDGSQALSMGAQAQGQTNRAFANLGVQEQQDYYNRLSNMNGAEQGMINEGDKVYQDQVRRWSDQVNITMGRNAIRQQQGQNMIQNGAMWAGMGSSMGGGGMAGGAGK